MLHLNSKMIFVMFVKDLKLLQEMQALWNQIDNDPKIAELIDDLKKDKLLKNNKIVIFTESKETENTYLTIYINISGEGNVLLQYQGLLTPDTAIKMFPRQRHNHRKI